jgi:hypothetical protein
MLTILHETILYCDATLTGDWGTKHWMRYFTTETRSGNNSNNK